MKIIYVLPFLVDASPLVEPSPLYWTRYLDRSGGHFSRDGSNAEALSELIRNDKIRCKVQAYLDINGIDYDQRPLNKTRHLLTHWKAYDATHGGHDQIYYDTLIALHDDPAFVAWCKNNLPTIQK